MSKVSLKKVIDNTAIADGRDKNDTIRLWESYKEQAILWRALTLIQTPVTFVALILAFTLWQTRVTNLTVPAKPLPGFYRVEEIPDTEFVEHANEFISLIATYQHAIARRQFIEARNFLQEPMLSRFDKEMLGMELQAIESTKRTQIFFIDPTQTKVVKDGQKVDVFFVGERQKIVAGKEMAPVATAYTVSITTVPKNKLNPYGMMITNVSYDNVQRLPS